MVWPECQAEPPAPLPSLVRSHALGLEARPWACRVGTGCEMGPVSAQQPNPPSPKAPGLLPYRLSLGPFRLKHKS